MKRAALYVRVSTQEQKKHGLSVDSQILALQEFCKANGYIVAGVYNDAGISARKSYKRRPALLRLVRDCEEKKVDIILFTKLDRFFRSVADYYEVQRQLEIYKVPWRAIWEDYETETSSGIFKVNIMLSVAQSEADRTSERIKSAMAYKRQRGDYVGSAPIGYKVVGRDLIIDKKAEPGMKAFFEDYFENFSISKAVEKAYEYDLKLSGSHMCKLIKNSAYCGETSQGYKCPAYITEEQHRKILETIGKTARQPKVANRIYMFSGLCYCGYCGHRMSGKAVTRTHVDGSKIEYKKYVCNNARNMKYNCPHLQITENKIEEFLLMQLDEIIGDYKIDTESIIIESKKPSNKKRRAKLEKKLERNKKLYLCGDISEEEYIKTRDETKEELSQIVTAPTRDLDVVFPSDWHEIYAALDEKLRREFWLDTVKKITITNENKNNPDVELIV